MRSVKVVVSSLDAPLDPPPRTAMGFTSPPNVSGMLKRFLDSMPGGSGVAVTIRPEDVRAVGATWTHPLPVLRPAVALALALLVMSATALGEPAAGPCAALRAEHDRAISAWHVAEEELKRAAATCVAKAPKNAAGHPEAGALEACWHQHPDLEKKMDDAHGAMVRTGQAYQQCFDKQQRPG